MPRIRMTYELAMAAASDKANRRMRRAGRIQWDRQDYAMMVAEFNRLMPMPMQPEQSKPASKPNKEAL